MKIAIIGNGDAVPYITTLPKYDVIIALDGGFKHCQALHINPTLVLGDGDSIETKTALFKLIPDQMTTDLHKGIQYVQMNYNVPYAVDLFSVTSGERLDHTLNAIQLATQCPEINFIYTPTQRLQIVRQRATLNLAIGTQFSLLPINGPALVDLVGSKWCGEGIILDNQHSGISNQIIEPTVAITVKSGIVLMITESLYGQNDHTNQTD